MISYKEAEKKACEFNKGFDVISTHEDEEYYIFAFGIKGERPFPGMELVRINKNTGELDTDNPIYDIQMNAPTRREDFFDK